MYFTFMVFVANILASRDYKVVGLEDGSLKNLLSGITVLLHAL